MENNIEEEIITKRKSSTNIIDQYDIEKLQQHHRHFVPCKIQSQGEIIHYTYNMTSLTCMRTLREMKEVDRLRLLIAVSHLERLFSCYQFTIHPLNIYYTKDYVIKIKERDMISEKSIVSFIECYRSLIGYTFLEKYTYDDILQGGLSLLRSNHKLRALITCSTTLEILELLYSWYDQEMDKQTPMVCISKRRNVMHVLTTVTLAIALVIVSVFTLYQHRLIKEQDVLLEVHNLFINSKFEDTMDLLVTKNSDDFCNEEKYILAVSYIMTSILSKEQKNNALLQVDVKGPEEYILFWVYLANNDFEQAYELVSYINEDDLLYYVYIIELNSIAQDTEIPTEQKLQRRKQLEDLLEDYNTKSDDNK